MNYTNVAMIEEYSKPIAASCDWNTLLDLVDDYFGPESKRLGWYVSNAKYPDAYVGYFEYREDDGEIVKVKIYEVDFK
jgi:hypothetical protein